MTVGVLKKAVRRELLVEREGNFAMGTVNMF